MKQHTSVTTQLSSGGPPQVRIRAKARRGGALLLDLPIGARLTLSFILAAIIAAVVSGAMGVLRAQSLDRQSEFYQNLLYTNTRLTTGAQFLQVMNSETKNIMNRVLTSTDGSSEDVNGAIEAVKRLVTSYDGIIKEFTTERVLNRNPEQIVLLQEAGQFRLIKQQETLAASALRTWNVHKSAQLRILDNIVNGKLPEAQTFSRVHVEPTNADSLSAVRALTTFNNRLAKTVQNAAAVEEQRQLLITAIGAVVTFIAILIIGWLISGTIVRRLRSLRQVTQAVEHGELTRRVDVIGRDEIADVSASVNAMLDAISNLVGETRSQRDALANAAEHLFSDMRVVSAGDLRINASVSNDPIGMLANAFNFTVGRFRRFVMRTKTAAEQLDVVAHQGQERAEAFIQATQVQSSKERLSGPLAGRHSSSEISTSSPAIQYPALVAQLRQTREQLNRLINENILRQTRATGSLVEQIVSSLDRLQKISTSTPSTSSFSGRYSIDELMRSYAQELYALDPLLKRMVYELQGIHKSALKGFQELDKDLDQMGAHLRTMSSRSSSEGSVPVVVGVGSTQRELDLQRLGSAFASEITTMARQLTALAQELRTGVISFQLEGGDSQVQGNTQHSQPGFQAPLHQSPHSSTYNLAVDVERHTPHPGVPNPSKRLFSSIDQ